MRTPRTRSTSSPFSGIVSHRILLTAILLLFAGSKTVEGTITVLSTGETFSSEPVKGLGQHMWKGSEYVGRLQYLPQHMDLCDIKQPVSVKIPKDSVPIALLASAGGCSKEDQAKIASTMITPKNVVQYLIIEDLSKKRVILDSKTGQTEEVTLDIQDDEELDDEELEDEELLFNLLKEGILQDGTINLAVLKIGKKSYSSLLSITAMESHEDRLNGGTKISLNSKVPNQTARTFLAWFTISLAFCCCSCFCVSLAYQRGVFTIETEPDAPPPRPVRRRLTVAQVREKFPSYRYYPSMNGDVESGEGENNDEDGEEGLETSSQMLGECSICLDDFLPGQRVRQLPCGHVFHSTCIARWLVERNAVCPLCKLDVYEEEEESSSSSEEEEQADPLVSETPNREQELADQALASGSRSSWWPFSSSSSPSPAPGTRWAMRLLSRQRRGNGDNDMLTEMTNPLLAADRDEAVEVVEFQPTANDTADETSRAPEHSPPEPEENAVESASPQTSSSEDTSTTVEV